MTTERIKIHNEGQEWEMMEINSRWAQWTIESAGVEGDVTIECFEDNNTSHLSLSQDELKQVIAFLQKQVKTITI